MDIMLNRILTLIGTEHGSAQKLVKAIGASKNAVTDFMYFNMLFCIILMSKLMSKN